MSVFMSMQAKGDARAWEQFAGDNPEKMQQVLESAKSHGLIAHRFYGSDDGANVLILDEWPDRQSFESFFQENESDIRSMMGAAQVSGQPTPMYWSELATGDAFGWGA
ncbi:MAG: hypothetical protein HOV83_27360 [Catenulispora sp.]|nr:hypothetical protein [Catenulispora sp.]